MIDISKLDKVEVFRVLYEYAKVQGMGTYRYDPKPMSYEEAKGYITKTIKAETDLGQYGTNILYFDHVKGRAMKVDLTGDTFDPEFYDRDNGEGAAARAIATLQDGVIDLRLWSA